MALKHSWHCTKCKWCKTYRYEYGLNLTTTNSTRCELYAYFLPGSKLVPEPVLTYCSLDLSGNAHQWNWNQNTSILYEEYVFEKFCKLSANGKHQIFWLSRATILCLVATILHHFGQSVIALSNVWRDQLSHCAVYHIEDKARLKDHRICNTLLAQYTPYNMQRVLLCFVLKLIAVMMPYLMAPQAFLMTSCDVAGENKIDIIMTRFATI